MPANRKRFGGQRKLSSGSGSLGNSSFNLGSLTPRFNKNLFRRGGIQVIPRVKFVEFDRSIIKTNWKAINRTPLQRSANLIRIIARQSIKRRKLGGAPSRRGNPPFSRYGEGRRGSKTVAPKTPPFKMIFNVPTITGTGQIIGMVGFNANSLGELPPPGLHELGGFAKRRVKNPNALNHIRPLRDRRGRFKRRVIPARIRRSVRYPKRPFMVPAVQKARTRLPGFWRNSVRRGGMGGIGTRIV